ncbi:hypothetical protein M231_01554 [Tremella mesenterica]|uniref:Uncharacterized protein n=1 Tax=Tremella mesenterica TaxID=5217 RepID=A0A4Q1BSY0_TREME|nr:uncharacterized protein TREMEDRAFT_64500 [Tremella mesenterica DSM 1558]EIW67250.1 hypothetical protein TREMEDRAFT_64500 [Tremella mesenterica DSM 1558]RXK41151.1 hypothetical protein M231_01554 [Tremella mesenterica]
MSAMLIREHQTDLRPFSPPDIELAHGQWLLELHRRMAHLEQIRADTPNDFEYGGAAPLMADLARWEDAVDEARRMVYALGGEMRRRSEGEVPVWNRQKGRATTGNGMMRGSSAGSALRPGAVATARG